MSNTRFSRSVQDRFLKYAAVGRPKECWIWKGSLMVRGGYGQLNDRGKLLKAHRISYELYRGKIPKGRFICHKCNNPPCVNPSHLYAGTAQQNWADTRAAGNAYQFENLGGEKCRAAKLNWEKVRAIRSSQASLSELSKKFKVSTQSVWKIRKGFTWKE